MVVIVLKEGTVQGDAWYFADGVHVWLHPREVKDRDARGRGGWRYEQQRSDERLARQQMRFTFG